MQCKYTVTSLQGSLSKVKGIFKEEEESAFDKTLNSLETKRDNKQIMSLLLDSTDPEALSYLWLAIEQNRNILIFNCKISSTNSFIDSISSFVPRYHIVLDPRKGKELDNRINFIKTLNYDNLSKKEKIRNIDGLMPNRVLANENSDLGFLFPLTKNGISFIASLEGNLYNKQIIRTLQSKFFQIKPIEITALDLSIFLIEEEGKFKVKAITEYRWLEKAEIKVPENEFVPKDFKNVQIVKDKILNKEELKNSKIIEYYADSNLISVKEAMKELDNRTDFLKEIKKQIELSEEFKSIESYYEIR